MAVGLVAGCGRVGFDPLRDSQAAHGVWTLIETSSDRVMDGPLAIPRTGAGNLIVVAVQSDDSNTATNVTDNAGTTYQRIAGSRAMAPGVGLAIELWYAENSLAGATSISAATIPVYSITHWEVAGIRTNNALDTVAQLDDQPTTSMPAGPNITTTTSGQLIITVAIVENVVGGLEANSMFTNDHTTFGNGFAHLTSATAPAATYRARWSQPMAGTFCATAASFFPGP
jgi:hypothetical protein